MLFGLGDQHQPTPEMGDSPSRPHGIYPDPLSRYMVLLISSLPNPEVSVSIPQGNLTSAHIHYRNRTCISQTHFLSHLIFLLLHSEQLCTTLRLVATGFRSYPTTDFHFPGEPGTSPSSHSSGLAAKDCNPATAVGGGSSYCDCLDWICGG